MKRPLGGGAYFFGGLYKPTTTAWSRSYGSRVSCSLGLNWSFCSFATSAANTASGVAVESMHEALMLTTNPPPALRKYCEFSATMRAWSGCATSAKTQSTMPTSMRYFKGCLASCAGLKNEQETTHVHHSRRRVPSK